MSDAALAEWVRLGPSDEVSAELHLRRSFGQALFGVLYPAALAMTSWTTVIVDHKPIESVHLFAAAAAIVIVSVLAWTSPPWRLDIDFGWRSYQFVHGWRRNVREGTFDDLSELLAEDRVEFVRVRLLWKDASRSPTFAILSEESALEKMGAAFGLPVREVAPSWIFRFFHRKIF